MAPSLRGLGNARPSMLNKPRALSTRAEFAADIRREWANALESTVAVGRRLNEAKEALPHGEYEAMIAADLPFSTSTARKLREVAAFVDRDKVPLDRLPEAMSTLYAIATLPDETRAQALDQGVIRPEVTRAEVEALKPPKPAAPVVERSRLLDLFTGPAELEETAADLVPFIESTKTVVTTLSATAPGSVLTIIDGEAVPVVTPAQPTPPAEPKPSPLEGAIDRPWSVDPEDSCSILAHMEHGKRVALTGLHADDATAALVQYVVGLHNAKLMGG